MTVTATIYSRVQATQAAALDFGGGGPAIDKQANLSLTPGTGVGQANKMFADTRTLAASATENLDLNGALTDVLGVALNLLKVKAIQITADPANTNDVIVGGAASNGFLGPLGGATHTLAIKPGASITLTATGAGWPVVAATGDLLKIANGGAGTPVNYDIVIIGTDA